jgi:cell division protein YceG involved in septum cleavage
MRVYINSIKPYFVIAFGLVLSVFLFILFLKLFVLGLVIAVILYLVHSIVSAFKRPTSREDIEVEIDIEEHHSSETHKLRGRTFDHDEFK